MSIAVAEPIIDTYQSIDDLFDSLWAVIVWNDDVNSFEHVIECFIKYVGHTPERAEKLAIDIHVNGKACVCCRPKEEAETIVKALLDNQLQATLVKG